MTNDKALALRAGETRAPATLDEYAHNLKSKLDMAMVLITSGLLPAHLKTPQAVVTTILYGQELGFSPLQSCRTITVIQGKPTVDAAGLQALAQAAGGVIEVLEHSERICRLKVSRGKSFQEASFTMDEAAAMGLASKDNWRRMPKDMLYARAVSRGVRRMFADCICGFYSTEEMRDSTGRGEEQPAPVEARVIEATAAVAGIVPADSLPPKSNEPVYYLIPNITSDQYLYMGDIGEELGGGYWLVYGPDPKVRRKLKKYEASKPETLVIRDEKGASSFINPDTGEQDDLPESMTEEA